jgi:hypothetical protein
MSSISTHINFGRFRVKSIWPDIDFIRFGIDSIEISTDFVVAEHVIDMAAYRADDRNDPIESALSRIDLLAYQFMSCGRVIDMRGHRSRSDRA